MPETKLQYDFPWQRGPIAGSEGFDLLDGAIRGAVHHNGSTNPKEQYSALVEPGLLLGTFATAEQARAAVEEHAANRINAMLAIILPHQVQEWLKKPL
jgi:hypothetical protein